MKKKIKLLHDWGCDTKTAMERMLDDEDFYIECLNDIPEDSNFSLLTEALDNHDITAAFDAAHTLKGVFANLGLTPMYNEVVKIVEPLRDGNGDNLTGYNQSLQKMKDYLSEVLNSAD